MIFLTAQIGICPSLCIHSCTRSRWRDWRNGYRGADTTSLLFRVICIRKKGRRQSRIIKTVRINIWYLISRGCRIFLCILFGMCVKIIFERVYFVFYHILGVFLTTKTLSNVTLVMSNQTERHAIEKNEATKTDILRKKRCSFQTSHSTLVSAVFYVQRQTSKRDINWTKWVDSSIN